MMNRGTAVGHAPRWLAVLCILCLGSAAPADDQPDDAFEETITRHTLEDGEGGAVAYLIHQPRRVAPPAQRALVVFLHGAGGSLSNYNLTRTPYARLRAAMAERGWYVLVPELGGRHFMNDAAKANLDALLDRVVRDYQIPPSRVHLMGTSMGGGSSLAYVIHRPGAIRSVCAIMPMTDFALWAAQNPKYGKQLAEAYGGTPAEKPAAYAANSAMQNLDAFALTPVMLFHGSADPTVVVEHSEKLAAGLTSRGYRCVFHRVEGLAHTSSIMSNNQLEIVAFFEDAMQP